MVAEAVVGVIAVAAVAVSIVVAVAVAEVAAAVASVGPADLVSTDLKVIIRFEHGQVTKG